MVSIKGGTQTWSPAVQNSSFKPDNTQTLSPGEQQKLLGEGNIGDVLNKVADPNWVDPAKVRRVGNSQLDKDSFLKLLLTQLKNQDPTSPMESHEMAAQLAQFSSLEKLQNIESGINKLDKGTEAQNQFDLYNLIGKGVSGDSSKIVRGDVEDIHTITFETEKPAASILATIKDRTGNVVKMVELQGVDKGRHDITWKGETENGAVAAEGEYKVDFVAKGADGQKVAIRTTFDGTVTGFNLGAQGPVLQVGRQTIKLSDVKRIYDPAMALQQAAMESQRPRTAPQGTPVAPVAASNNLEQVGMSREMLNRLAKETGKNGGVNNGHQ